MAAILTQYSTRGFYKAPVSKGILGCMFLTSCALNVPLLAHMKQYVVYSIPNIFEKFELWRVITSKLTFLETNDLVCGCLLIYYFRVFERRFGSHKYASYLLAASTVATVLELLVVYCLRKIDVHIMLLPTGPYGIIFPLFVNYFMDIPRVARTYIMGVPVTGKTLTYLLGFQVMSTNKSTMISAICSLVAGAICRWNLFKFRDAIKFPKFIARSAQFALGWILNSSPPNDGSLPMGATLEIQRQQRIEMIEQHVLFNQARERRGNANNYRQQMAQGYAERLVPPNTDGSGLFGSFQEDSIWNNPFGVRNRRTNVNGNDETGASTSSNRNHASPPQEDQVTTLVEMGFDRQSVVQALQTSNNDVNMATAILLNES